jgi:3-hydroxyacyl-CoA dehydrogenase
MSHSPLRIRKVAVLGAGVMGAQIAAHLTNADVETVLFDLPAKEGPKSGIAIKAIANLGKLSPAPLAEKSRATAITPANYDEHLDLLKDCDLIIEAIAERLDWKLDLYKKIAPYVSDSLPAIPRDFPSIHWPRHCRPRCARAFPASTSSTRHATCTWSS